MLSNYTHITRLTQLYQPATTTVNAQLLLVLGVGVLLLGFIAF